MKKSTIRLSLNKMTISNLDAASMDQKVGGLTGKGCSDTSCVKSYCDKNCTPSTITAGPPIKK